MLEKAGVLDATSSGAYVSFEFYPAHLMVTLSSGGPVYVSATSTAGTLSGLCLTSTSLPHYYFRATVSAMNAGTSYGRKTDLPMGLSAICGAGVTGGLRYWALSY